MTYQPKPGDIGLTQIPGSVGRAIRFGQWLNGDGFADVEHAFVYVGTPGPDNTYPGFTPSVIEAMPGGALLSPLSRYDGMGTVYLRCPDEYREGVTAAALALRGTPYSFLDYGALALHRFHIPTPLLRRYIEQSRSMICSQLADLAAERGGWHLFADGRWNGDVTPGDLWGLVRVQNDSGQKMHRPQ